MNYQITIRPDDCPLNPREENDCFCHLALAHKRRTLGDEDQHFNTDDFNGWDEVQEWLEDEKDAHLILPVSAVDHSCFHVYIGLPNDPWDSGQIGFAYVTEEELHKEFGYGQDAIDKAKELIKAEIEEYDKYLNGEIYFAVIKDEDGKVVESCGNFMSEEDAQEWANDTVECLKHDDAQEEVDHYRQMQFDF